MRLKLSQNKLLPNFRTIYRSFAKHDPNITGVISPELFDKVPIPNIHSVYNRIKYF
jgi:dynactin complex subunit